MRVFMGSGPPGSRAGALSLDGPVRIGHTVSMSRVSAGRYIPVTEGELILPREGIRLEARELNAREVPYRIFDTAGTEIFSRSVASRLFVADSWLDIEAPAEPGLYTFMVSDWPNPWWAWPKHDESMTFEVSEDAPAPPVFPVGGTNWGRIALYGGIGLGGVLVLSSLLRR